MYADFQKLVKETKKRETADRNCNKTISYFYGLKRRISFFSSNILLKALFLDCLQQHYYGITRTTERQYCGCGFIAKSAVMNINCCQKYLREIPFRPVSNYSYPYSETRLASRIHENNKPHRLARLWNHWLTYLQDSKKNRFTRLLVTIFTLSDGF